MRIFKRKEKALTLSIEDLGYIYQYIVLKYKEAVYFKNLYFLLVKRREDLFDFISQIDPEYLKKTNLVYITADMKHNHSLFDEETNNILILEINDKLIDYLRAKVDNWNVFKRIDTEFNRLFKTKGSIFLAFVFVLGGILFIVGYQFQQIELGSIHADLSSVFLFYDLNYLLTSFLFFVVFSVFIYTYLKHIPMMVYPFSKYYLLLKYKQAIYNMLLRHYHYKGPWKRPEMLYINVYQEFNKVVMTLYPYLQKDEFTDVLFFLENPRATVNIRNPFLKQDLINDYKRLREVQNEWAKEKLDFLDEVAEKNIIYNNMLKQTFEEEFDRIKEFLDLKWVVLYLVITLIVMAMIVPVVMSAM